MRVLFFLLFFLPFLAKAQQPFIRDLWLNESNTPVKVNAIVQDNNGYVWLGTDEGIYRFNGRSFLLVKDSVKKPVTALAIGNGEVYAGYADGSVAVIRNTVATTMLIYNAIPHTAIRDIAVKGDLVLLSTEDGIFGIMNNMGIVLNTDRGLSDNFTYTICVYANIALIGTDKGINIVTELNGKLLINALAAKDGKQLPDNIVRIIKPAQEKDAFWVGTQEGGIGKIYLEGGGDFNIINSSKPWKWGQVNDIVPVSENNAWVATDDGFLVNVLLSKDSTSYHAYYIGKSMRKLALGSSGNIWCATPQGITMTTSEYASYIHMPAAFSLNSLTATVCDNRDKLWFTQNKKLYSISLTDTGFHPALEYTSSVAITCLFVDSSNGLWIGTFGKGLWYMKNKKVVQVNDIADLGKASILSIAGLKNEIWIASLNGVEETKVADTVKGSLQLIKHHNKQSGIGSDYVYQLYTDRMNRIWMATDGAGICMFDGINYHHWDSADGISSKVIYTITEDADTNIWVGTLDKGLFFFDGVRYWHASHKNDGLQDINVSAIAANNTGQVIIVHQKGIDEWYPASHEFRHYNRRFLPLADSMSTVLNCIAKDSKGNVYTPFNDGFIVFNNQYNNYNIKPYVHINTVSIFLNSLPELVHKFSYDQNYVTINFDGINYTSPDPLYYRYLLEGYNNKWVYTNDESVTFPLLPPGKYKFHVEASINKNFYKAGKDVYIFVIATPYWKQRWFMISVLLVTVAIIYSYVKWREGQITKMSKLQRERMMYEYEHLKSQVNPHFLFNSLNTLTHLIEEDKNVAIDYTSQLSDMYRHMLSYRDRDLILLSEEWEILSGYMYIQQSRFGNALRLESNISSELLKTKKIVPLALQIVVENAIKHNTVSVFSPLVIYITANDEQITIRNRMKPKISKEKGAGLGLVNISKRYALLSKKEVSFGVYNNEFVVKLPLL